MPQMAPLSWTILFLTFSILFFVSITKLFFILNNKPQVHKSESNPFLLDEKLNWKW